MSYRTPAVQFNTNNDDFTSERSEILSEEDTASKTKVSASWKFSFPKNHMPKIDRLRHIASGMSFGRLSDHTTFSFFANPISLSKYFSHFKKFAYSVARPPLGRIRLRLSRSVRRALSFSALRLNKASDSRLLMPVSLLLNHIGIGTDHLKKYQ